MEYRSICSSPIGDLTLVCDDIGLTQVSLLPRPDLPLQNGHPLLSQARQWLDRYFLGKTPDPAELPLHPQGTAYQKSVWAQLLTIPWGESRSYGQLAQEITAQTGTPTSPRAIGAAVGKNPLWILIPCHRVLGAKGQLTGYAGGIENKMWLLRHEGIPFKEKIR